MKRNVNPETGPCSSKHCKNIGELAHGAKDIAPMAARTGVFVKTFLCDDCLSAAAQRSLGSSLRGRPLERLV